MDLQAIIRSGPCHAGAEQFGHAGLEIAAMAVVFLPCGIIGQLTGDHNLNRHHGQLAGHAREFDQRFAELFAVLTVLHGHIKRGLCHADGTGGGLDAGGLEGAHQLLEALTFFATQQVVAFDVEIIKAQLVFLHAAIAQHLDLAAGHAFGWKGGLVRAGGFFGDEHRQSAVIGGVGIGAGQQGHDMGAGSMGDPCLVAGDFVIAVLVLYCAGAKCAKIRACIRFGKDGSRQNFGAGDLGQPVFFLRIGAAAFDQFGGDFRACAQRADADIAARQFLGHHDHRGL